LVDWEIVSKDLDYEGASSQMEFPFAVAVRMAERWCAKGCSVWMLVIDADGTSFIYLNLTYINVYEGKIFSAFKMYNQSLRPLTCAAHMVKNFSSQVDALDTAIGKRRYSMKRLYSVHLFHNF
jgi:hypothetical protein